MRLLLLHLRDCRILHVSLILLAFNAGAFRIHAQPIINIMPLGDSITRGNNDINFPNGDIPGGYRQELGKRLTQAGVAFDFVGSRIDNAADGMDPHHEGAPGMRTEQILANFSNFTAASPDIVLLMAGTNDILQNIPIPTAIANLNNLIVQITQGAPSRKLYIATILPILQSWPPFNPQYTAAYLNSQANLYNTELRNLVQQQAAQGRNITLVDMNALIMLNDGNPANAFYQPGDSVHPGQGGYDQLGARWYQAINPAPPVEGIPASPNGLTTTVESSSRINLAWSDPSTNETSIQVRRRIGLNGVWETIATLSANTTHYAATGLATGSFTYSFSVRAQNGFGPSDWSAVTSSTLTNEDRAHLKPASASTSFSSEFLPPKANDGLTSTRWASTGVTNHFWSVDLTAAYPLSLIEVVTTQANDVNVEVHRKNFEIRASNDPTFASYAVLGSQGNTALPHKATFSLSVTHSTPFRYVRVAKTDGQSFAIALVRVFGSNPVSTPVAPTQLVASPIDSKYIRLTWNVPSINESGFKLERKVGVGGTYTQVAEIHAARTLYLDHGLEEATNYVYRIRAWNEAGDSTFGNEASVTTANQSAYQIWATSSPAFLELPPAQQSPGADPNADGTSNLLAYAMALDPLVSASLPMIETFTTSPNSSAFKFRRNTQAPDISYQVLVTDDLSSGIWNPVDLINSSAVSLAGTPEVEEVTVPLPAGPGWPRQFVRLKVLRSDPGD